MSVQGRIEFSHQNDTYYNGGEIKGHLIYRADKPVFIESIYMRFMGHAEVRWTDMESRDGRPGSEAYEVTYRGREDYIDQLKQIHTVSSGVTLSPGDNAFPFIFYLPPIIPSSYSGRNGRVYYRVVGFVEQLRFPPVEGTEVEKEFYVVSPVDLSCDMFSLQPFIMTIENVYAYCCQRRPINITVKAPYSGYCPGQVIKFDVQVNNHTKMEIKNLTITLRKQVSYHSSEPKSRYDEPHVELARTVKRRIRQRTRKTLKMELKVPDMIAVNLEECDIIDMAYSLKLSYQFTEGTDYWDYEEAKFMIGDMPTTIRGEYYRHPMKHLFPKGMLPRIDLNYSTKARVIPGLDSEMAYNSGQLQPF